MARQHIATTVSLCMILSIFSGCTTPSESSTQEDPAKLLSATYTHLQATEDAFNNQDWEGVLERIDSGIQLFNQTLTAHGYPTDPSSISEEEQERIFGEGTTGFYLIGGRAALIIVWHCVTSSGTHEDSEPDDWHDDCTDAAESIARAKQVYPAGE